MSNTSSQEFSKDLCRNCTTSWINIYLSPRRKVNQVEACVMLAAAFLLILLVLGPMRRRSGSWIVQYGVMGAYMLSFPLLSYILGLMQGIVKNEMYPVWCTFIVLLFGGANSVSVQQLDDNKKWLKLMVENALYLYYVGTIARNVLLPGADNTITWKVLVPSADNIRFWALVVLFLLVSFKNIERLGALVLASDARSSGSWTVYHYMKKLCLCELVEYDASTMQGYKYLVLPMQVDNSDNSRAVAQEPNTSESNLDIPVNSQAVAQEPNTSEINMVIISDNSQVVEQEPNTSETNLDIPYNSRTVAQEPNTSEINLDIPVNSQAVAQEPNTSEINMVIISDNSRVVGQEPNTSKINLDIPDNSQAMAQEPNTSEINLDIIVDNSGAVAQEPNTSEINLDISENSQVVVQQLNTSEINMDIPDNSKVMGQEPYTSEINLDIIPDNSWALAQEPNTSEINLDISDNSQDVTQESNTSEINLEIKNNSRPVAQESNTSDIDQRDKLVTLEKIWCHESNSILSIEDPAMYHLKDVCFSFALFRLALRRYFGYSCAESGLTKTRDLVLQGLLLKVEEAHELERAFHVIEVELAFLYDFFFTKHATTMCRGEVRSFALSLGITVLTMGMGTYALLHPTNRDKFWDFGLIETEKQDIIVTIVIFCAVAIFLLVQYCLYMSSDWPKVSLVCKYITKKGCFNEKLLWFMGHFWFFLEWLKWFPRWQNKIGQYSFMDSFNHPCCGLGKFSKFIHKFRKGRKRGTSIRVPMEVKQAIARTLKDSEGLISDGLSSLGRHGVTAELGWSCQTNREFTLAHVILIWHIATGCCEYLDQSDKGAKREKNKKHIIVATSLSKYCAYLVAFAPHLLPGSPLETESTLDELVREARDTFKDDKLLSKIYAKLAQLHAINSNELTGGGMLTDAAKLAEILKTMEMEERWELLAEFWAEFMLYIAPSDNIAGHMESLAKGGEFVTHVWALLMHAGILERPAAAAAAAAR